MGQQQLPVLSPSSHSLVGDHSSPAPFGGTSSCPFAPPASPTPVPSQIPLSWGYFYHPGLPTLGPLHQGGKRSGGVPGSSPAVLAGTVQPQDVQESTIKNRAVLSHNVFDSCSVTTWEDPVLIKLNCFSIKRNIYEDAASTADLLVFCKQTDFLMSPPSRILPFLPGCYIFLLSAFVFVVSFRGAERMSPSPSGPLAVPWCALISLISFAVSDCWVRHLSNSHDLTVVLGTPKSTSLEVVPWFFRPVRVCSWPLLPVLLGCAVVGWLCQLFSITLSITLRLLNIVMFRFALTDSSGFQGALEKMPCALWFSFRATIAL